MNQLNALSNRVEYYGAMVYLLGCCLRIGPGIGADSFGAVMPARGKRLASLEALRASSGSGRWPRVGTRLARAGKHLAYGRDGRQADPVLWRQISQDAPLKDAFGRVEMWRGGVTT
jgi:hypothetical protein